MPQVSPTRTDPVAENGSQGIGGPRGRWAAPASAARSLQVVLLVGTATFVLGALRTVPCSAIGWALPQRDQLMCYSDIPALYVSRGLVDGLLPYINNPGQQPFEYPVLSGVFAWVAALLTPSREAGDYYWVNVVMLFVCFLVTLAATAMTVRHRVWDGLLLALAPSVFLAGLINWDWFVVALTSLALLAWARSRPVLAGVIFGLAIAAKFYPLVILGPLLLLCWRRGQLPAFAKCAGAAAVTWLVVNLPFMIWGWEGWSYFFTFSQERGQDFGSIWLAFSLLGRGVDAAALNAVALIALILACAGIGYLTLTGPRPPRLAQVTFLVVTAFLLTNKVYSPQYVLWMLPLAVLARPRWRDFLIWQACEAVYFAGVWWYIIGLRPESKGLAPDDYAWTILIHVAGTAYLAYMVVRDVRRPELDPVRADLVEGLGPFDDPGGGVLDGAPDRMVPSDDAAPVLVASAASRR